MHKNSTRTKHGRHLIRHDIDKLKAILAITAKDVGGEARNALNDSYEKVKDSTATLQESVTDYVSAKPYKAMALASFVGLAFGLAMRRKRRIRTRY